jgi:hypothetical protein
LPWPHWTPGQGPCPNTDPRPGQDPPRVIQDLPRAPQDPRRPAQELPRPPQDRPKRAQDRPQSVIEGSHGKSWEDLGPGRITPRNIRRPIESCPRLSQKDMFITCNPSNVPQTPGEPPCTPQTAEHRPPKPPRSEPRATLHRQMYKTWTPKTTQERAKIGHETPRPQTWTPKTFQN